MEHIPLPLLVVMKVKTVLLPSNYYQPEILVLLAVSLQMLLVLVKLMDRLL
jgi:hypothetical protein